MQNSLGVFLIIIVLPLSRIFHSSVRLKEFTGHFQASWYSHMISKNFSNKNMYVFCWIKKFNPTTEMFFYEHGHIQKKFNRIDLLSSLLRGKEGISFFSVLHNVTLLWKSKWEHYQDQHI